MWALRGGGGGGGCDGETPSKQHRLSICVPGLTPHHGGGGGHASAVSYSGLHPGSEGSAVI